MSITRGFIRYGIISGLALGGATLLIGPERVTAGLAHVRTKAQTVVDNCVDDPTALRRQLAELAEQYPDRIAEVETEIAEVDHQLALFEHDVNVSKVMISDMTTDLEDLRDKVARAEAAVEQGGARTTSFRNGSGSVVQIRFQGVRLSIDEAYREGARINTGRAATVDRLKHDEVQMKFLQEQKQRLAEIYNQLSSEYETYMAKLWQLDRQIEAIERNDRLIEMTAEQQATLQSYERFGKVQNLHQLESKLAELRRKQDAQLKTLERGGVSRDYEAAAEYQLNTKDIDLDPFNSDNGLLDDDAIELEVKPLAWSDPIVIE